MIKRLILSSLMAGATLVGWADPAVAQKRVVLHHRDLSAVVPLSDLTRLVQTGQSTNSLQRFLRTTPLTEPKVIELLTRPFQQQGLPLDRDDRRFIGIQVGTLVGDPRGRERPQAVLTALDRAFAGDGQLTFLEVIEQYPSSTVRIELNRISRFSADTNRLVRRIGPIFNQLLPELICDCDTHRGNPARCSTASTDGWDRQCPIPDDGTVCAVA